MTLLLTLFVQCGSEPLACDSNAYCEAVWPGFAPVCHDGACSECDLATDCGVGCWTCETGSDGFGTCVPDVCDV